MATTVPADARRSTPFLPAPSRYRGADGATIAALFVVALLVIPARLVIRGLPLSMTPAEVIGLSMALWWLCAHFTTSLGAAKGALGVRTALFCYAAALLATYGYATYGYLPADELSMADHAAVLVVANLGVALVMCDGLHGAGRVDFVLKTVVVAGAVIAVVGALQFVFGFDLASYLKLPALRYTSEGDFVIERSAFRRVAATTGHPIEFGVVSAMILPLAAHYGFRARTRGEPARRWWLCTGLVAAGVMFSVSRSAMLSLAGVGLVLLIGWHGRRRLHALLAAAGFLVVIKLAVPGLLGTFYGLFANFGSDNSIKYRTHDYDVAAAEIAKHPWLGRGLGTWYAPKHQVFDNQYLMTLLETGVIGLAVFLGVFICAFYAALRVRAAGPDPVRRDLGLALAASLVVPLIGSATFDLLSFHSATGLALVLVGAAGALMRAGRIERAREAGRSRSHPAAPVGGPAHPASVRPGQGAVEQ